jgi:uncharacterized protein (TIGR04222 family)
MNPFDLYGPQFLVFYVALGAVLLFGIWYLRRSGEPDPDMPVHLTDPYQIAYLRGGPPEVLRLATIGLIDRALLNPDDDRLRVADAASAQRVTHPVEQPVLEFFRKEGKAASVFSNATLKAACDRYRQGLIDLGLLPDGASKLRAVSYALVAAGILAAVSVTKIQIALERGRSNIQFLILLTVVFVFVAFSMAAVKRTRRADAFLRDMRTLLGPLKERSPQFVPRANTDEVMLLSAVFGIAALPTIAFPYARKLYPKAAGNSSCGSSCGSSGGSSCGGGGCGGGCGGCGS